MPVDEGSATLCGFVGSLGPSGHPHATGMAERVWRDRKLAERLQSEAEALADKGIQPIIGCSLRVETHAAAADRIDVRQLVDVAGRDLADGRHVPKLRGNDDPGGLPSAAQR